jgi:hypothetical protein
VALVTAQQQAFQAYYSSMTDAELLKIAANKRSFLEVAQAALADELRGRSLSPGEPSRVRRQPVAESHPNPVARMARKVRGWFSRER